MVEKYIESSPDLIDYLCLARVGRKRRQGRPKDLLVLRSIRIFGIADVVVMLGCIDLHRGIQIERSVNVVGGVILVLETGEQPSQRLDFLVVV